MLVVQRVELDLRKWKGLGVDELIAQLQKNGGIPSVDRLVELVELVRLEGLGRVLPGSDWWHVKIEMVGWRIESIDDDMDERPQVARVVEPGVEDLASICSQVDDTDLCKKKVEYVEVPGLA